MVATFSFASTDKCDSMVELTGRDFDTKIKFNASTGEEYCEWFAWNTDGHFICYTPSSLFSWVQQQATVGSLLRIQVFLPRISAERTEQLIGISMKEDLIDNFAPWPPFIRKSTNRVAKYTYISCLPRHSSLYRCGSCPWWIPPQGNKNI